MKQIQFFRLSVISILLLISLRSFALSIVGPTEVCKGECYTYEVNNAQGNSNVWTSSSGKIENNKGNNIEICFDVEGTTIIKVRDLYSSDTDQWAELEVIVYAANKPEIVFDESAHCNLVSSSSIEQENYTEESVTCFNSILFYKYKSDKIDSVIWKVSGGTIIDSLQNGIWIEWNKSGTGYINLTTINNGGCIDSTMFDLIVLPEIDVAISGSNGISDYEEACRDQEIYLEAIANGDYEYFWEVNNNSIFTTKNISFSFAEEGEYQIKLIAFKNTGLNHLDIYGVPEDSLENFCYCADTSFYIVKINSGDIPLIECTGTICDGEEAVYYASDNCDTYNWGVSSEGTITDGGGTTDNFISVIWSGNSYGEITLNTPACFTNVCKETNTVRIPIIGKGISILGKTVVCPDEISVFSIPYYDGTNYNWSIDKYGTIIDGLGTNQIKVVWNTSYWQTDPVAKINVSYDNCYLGCGDSASLEVSIQEKLKIYYFQDAFCLNDKGYFDCYPFDCTPNWKIIKPSGIVENSTDKTLSIEFDEVGIYKLKLEVNDGCSCNKYYEISVEVFDIPNPQIEIIGSLLVCKNEYSTYSIAGLKNHENIEWIVYDGPGNSNVSRYKTDKLTYKWTSNGPYKIEVIVINSITGCKSEQLDIGITTNIKINGSTIVCLDQVEEYDIDVFDTDNVNWTITPDDAGTTISEDSDVLKVIWNKPGTHKVSVDHCTYNYTLSVTVLPKPNISLVHPNKVCHGQLADIIITEPPYSNVSIFDRKDKLVSQSFNLQLPPDYYYIELEDENGCVVKENMEIGQYPETRLRISTPDSKSLCYFTEPVKIIIEECEYNYNYQWYKDNVSIGESSSSIFVSDFSTYHVEYEDDNGCGSVSNHINLYKDCNPDTFKCGTSWFNFNVNCDEYQFNIDTNGLLSDNFVWNFDDPESGNDNTSTELNPIHEFTQAGYFHVSVKGNLGLEAGHEIIEIPVVGNFEYDTVCSGSQVSFTNLSTFIPGVGNIKYYWDFGDPLSGSLNISTLKNPTHIFSGSGFYLVSLTVESDANCIYTKEKEVFIRNNPEVEILSYPFLCKENSNAFLINTDANLIEFEWDFGDPASGNTNFSSLEFPYHNYKNEGKYNVNLQVVDFFNCSSSTSKDIDIISNPISGPITSSETFPKCKDREVTLTAPAGGDNYYWSNGETGQTITIIDPDIYSVTMTFDDNCDYIPDPINVFNIVSLENEIHAIQYDNYIETVFYDSIEICMGEEFFLQGYYYSNVKYLWSDGTIKYYIPGNSFSALQPGRYKYDLEIEDMNTGCKIKSNPFFVIIHPNPDQPTIVSDNNFLCEEALNEIKIDPIDPNLNYRWQNGASSPVIISSIPGTYQVKATNEFGCLSESSEIQIHKKPNVNEWSSGCKEVCFPEELCLSSLNNNNIYQIMYDGAVIRTLDNSSPDLNLNEPGDYQLIIQNQYGCADTSVFLTLSALPDDQSLSGIVFVDDNKNGIYGIGEELLKNIIVYLKKGNSIIATSITDINGFYSFDPITDSHLTVVIDTSGTDYLYKGKADSLLFFDECIEDKEIDFPLYPDCNIAPQFIEKYVCSGESIVFMGVELYEGMKDTFNLITIDDCDSIIMVEVLSYPESKVSLDLISSCYNAQNGSISITKIIGDSLLFKIDEIGLYVSDTVFYNLSSGDHILYFIDKNGCEDKSFFTLPEYEFPVLDLSTNVSCQDQNNGLLSIEIVIGNNLKFALDSPTNYVSNTEFSNISVGYHTLWILYENDCIDSLSFEIEMIPEPIIEILTFEFCEDINMGSFTVNTVETELKYSLDSINFSENTYFENLSNGDFILYVLTKEECVFEVPFSIEGFFAPVLDLEINSTCEGEDNGSLQIVELSGINLKYSLDNIIFENNLDYSELKYGDYILYVEASNSCKYEYPFTIEETPLPKIGVESTNTCPDTKEGSIFINTPISDLLFSLNNTTFSEQSIFTDLSPGNYYIQVIDSLNCKNSIEVEISEYPSLSVEFPDLKTDCSTKEILISPTINESYGTIDYTWSDGTKRSELLARQSGTYNVKISDECMETTHSWDIEIEEQANEESLFVPNIFSPNDDSFNDCMKVRLDNRLNLLEYHIMIFDRWGEKLYESNDINHCWDGIFNGKPVQSGVYVYVIEYIVDQCETPKIIKKAGDITVVP